MRGRRNSIVDIVTRLRDERPMIRGSISFSETFTPVLGLSQAPVQWY
jgi:hypothetical protein